MLSREEIGRIIVGGTRCYDVGLRLALAGIDPQKIVLHSNYEEMTRHLLTDLTGAETIAVFFELYATSIVNSIKETLAQGGNAHENH